MSRDTGRPSTAPLVLEDGDLERLADLLADRLAPRLEARRGRPRKVLGKTTPSDDAALESMGLRRRARGQD